MHKTFVGGSLASLVALGGILLAVWGSTPWAGAPFVTLGLALVWVSVHRARSDRRSAAELARAHEAALLALRSRTTFLANITHDLRAPLGNVLLLVATLERELRGELTEEQRTAVNNIATNSRHVLDVLNDLLDLAKVEAARLELKIVTVDLLAVIDSALRLVYDQAAEKGLDLVEPDPTLEVYVRADEFRLKQALVNLLFNAVKFTPPGGRVGVRVDPEASSREVSVAVWDTGAGICPEEQERIFEPFVQLQHDEAREQGETSHRKGAGLGLALVKRIIEQHGGRIELTSELGLGSEFRLHIKRASKSSSRRRQSSSSGSLPPVSESVGA